MHLIHVLLILGLAVEQSFAITSSDITTVTIATTVTTITNTTTTPPESVDTTQHSAATSRWDTTADTPTSSEVTPDLSTTSPPTTSPPVHVVSTNCSRTALDLNPVPLGEMRQLVVTFPAAALGTNVSCLWQLSSLDNQTSNVFAFHTTYLQAACTNSMPSDILELYDTERNLGYWLLISDSCSGKDWKSTDLWGYPTTISYTSHNVSETAVILGTYSSSSQPWATCSNGSRTFVAGKEISVLTIPGDGLRIPNFAECSWVFRSVDQKYRVSVVINNRQSDINTMWCNLGTLSSKRITLHDVGYEEVSNEVAKDLCPSQVNLTYHSFSNVLTVNLSMVTYGGSAPFTITYSSSPTFHCPTGQPHVIHVPKAPQGQANFLMAINPVSPHGRPQICTWQLIAPPGMLVRLTTLYSKDYDLSASNDTLALDGGDSLSLQSRQTFPLWGKNATTLLQFTATPGSGGKRFVLKYLAVMPDQCQSRPINLQALLVLMRAGIPGMESYDKSGNSDCRWVIFTNNSDTVVNITIELQEPEDACQPANYQAYDGADPVPGRALKPRCPTHNTLVYQSHHSILLLMHRRLPGSPSDVLIYSAVSSAGPAPSGAGRGPTSPSSSLCLSLFCLLALYLWTWQP